ALRPPTSQPQLVFHAHHPTTSIRPLTPPPPRGTLFPYTTLFRSTRRPLAHVLDMVALGIFEPRGLQRADEVVRRRNAANAGGRQPPPHLIHVVRPQRYLASRRSGVDVQTVHGAHDFHRPETENEVPESYLNFQRRTFLWVTKALDEAEVFAVKRRHSLHVA